MNYEDLVGKPYRKDAAGPDAYDCWGLVSELFKRSGVILPNYHRAKTDKENGETILREVENGWQSIEDPVKGCIVLFLLHTGDFHIGYMVSDYDFIHVLLDGEVVVTRINDIYWSKNAVGFYTWAGSA